MTKKEENSKENTSNNNIEETTKLVLFNDEINSFDFVIDSLMGICEFEDTQAAQIAMLAHYKGKIVIKEGKKSELARLQYELEKAGLTVETLDV